MSVRYALGWYSDAIKERGNANVGRETFVHRPRHQSGISSTASRAILDSPSSVLSLPPSTSLRPFGRALTEVVIPLARARLSASVKCRSRRVTDCKSFQSFTNHVSDLSHPIRVCRTFCDAHTAALPTCDSDSGLQQVPLEPAARLVATGMQKSYKAVCSIRQSSVPCPPTRPPGTRSRHLGT